MKNIFSMMGLLGVVGVAILAFPTDEAFGGDGFANNCRARGGYIVQTPYGRFCHHSPTHEGQFKIWRDRYRTDPQYQKEAADDAREMRRTHGGKRHSYPSLFWRTEWQPHVRVKPRGHGSVGIPLPPRKPHGPGTTKIQSGTTKIQSGHTTKPGVIRQAPQ